MQDIFENDNCRTGWTGWRLEITNFLNIMEQAIFGAFCSSFPQDSGLPKNWIRRVKRMGPWKTVKTVILRLWPFKMSPWEFWRSQGLNPRWFEHWITNLHICHLPHGGKQNLPYAINLNHKWRVGILRMEPFPHFCCLVFVCRDPFFHEE